MQPLKTVACLPIIAAERSQASIVQLMLDAGADEDMADREGQTPLHLAAMHGHAAVVKVLLACFVPVKAAAGKGCLCFS